jgi:ABC-2 type transport system ATP-binding protein
LTEVIAMRDTPIEIEVRELSKTYPGGVEAVGGIAFEVAAGEVFGLLGPNGAGKSTTIGMLTNMVTPSSGGARLGGFDVVSQPLQARAISAVVSQDPAVDRALSGRRNLEIHARLWGVARAGEPIAEVVDVFGLGEIIDRPVGSYSGGQRRRLEIARALISRPRVLFLDEPTVGLDTRIRHELLDLIASLAGGEMTTLLTTHYLDEAQRLCDRVAIMSRGQIAAIGTPQALMASLGKRIIELRGVSDPTIALGSLRAAGVAGEDAFGVGQTITIPIHDGAPAHALAAIGTLAPPGAEINTRPPTLDDVYLHLTGERLAA